MKKEILFLLVVVSFQANSQSLKDALFGGKLKNDSNSVVRKTDDLSTKIDTARKKPEPEKPKVVVASTSTDSALTTATGNGQLANSSVPASPATVTKDNIKIWKEFMDTIVSTLNAEVMGSKQIRKGDYFVIVDYVIETNGQLTVTNVIPTPENKFLADQVRERININPPQMNPVQRKTNKRYSFTVSAK